MRRAETGGASRLVGCLLSARDGKLRLRTPCFQAGRHCPVVPARNSPPTPPSIDDASQARDEQKPSMSLLARGECQNLKSPRGGRPLTVSRISRYPRNARSFWQSTRNRPAFSCEIQLSKNAQLKNVLAIRGMQSRRMGIREEINAANGRSLLVAPRTPCFICSFGVSGGGIRRE
jgi:hypothetical protein